MQTSLLILATGLTALIISTVIFCRKSACLRHWVRASGLVVELIPKTKDDGDRRIVVFSPRVSFCLASGESVEFVSSYSSRPAIAEVGQTVRVLYDPANPQAAMIDSFLFRHMVEFLLLSVGLALLMAFAYERYAA